MAKKKSSRAKAKVSKHCTCENVTMSDIGRTRKRKIAKKTTRDCRIIRIKGRGARKLCKNSSGQWRFVKMSA